MSQPVLAAVLVVSLYASVVDGDGSGRAPKDWAKVETQEGWLAPPLASQEDLERLVTRISSVFTHSFRDLPPVPADGGPLAVGVRINLVKFQGLDEVEGAINLVLDLLLCWSDDRLSFDSNRTFHRPWSHAGDKLPIRSDLVWTPDIVVLSQVEGMDTAFAADDSPLVLADDEFKRRTGVNVLWTRRVNVKSRCNVDMANFPFDQQLCSLIVGSWASSQRQLMLVAQDSRQKVEEASTIHNSEFKVQDISVKKTDVYMHDAAERFDEILYEIRIQRQSHFYVVNFVMPMVAITMMTVATMWMSSTGTRTNSGTRLLLCVVQIMNITATWRPANQGDIWLDRFQSHCLAFSMASVLQSLVLDYLYGTGMLETRWCCVRANAIETVMRTAICLMAVGFLVVDLFELKHSDSFRGLYASFHGHSSKLLVGIVYFLFAFLGVSSSVSAAWLILPEKVWHDLLLRTGVANFYRPTSKEFAYSPGQTDEGGEGADLERPDD